MANNFDYPLITSKDDLAVRIVRELAPVKTNSITQFDPVQIRVDAADTRIIVHRRFPDLVRRFLQHKREHGTDIEKELYRTADVWTWQDQVRRLIEKRPLVFINGSDQTMLRDGTMIGSLAAEWDRVGTDTEDTSKYLKLKEYLSYDEMMLGSLMGVSGPSYFINDGARSNSARPGQPGSFEPRGFIVGLVGARFEREDRMDSVFCLPPVARPRQHVDLTQIFSDFFGKQKRHKRDFDTSMYKARIRIAFDVLLLEANDRGKGSEKKAYVHVVGLGLGVWRIDARQQDIFLEGFMDALNDHGTDLQNIGTLNFSYIGVDRETAEQMKAAGEKYGIDVLFTRRNPAAKLPPNKEGEVLVISYAWDSNSFPGNEYWLGSLTASGDPAAAAMSTISELHNPILNPQFLVNIKTLSL